MLSRQVHFTISSSRMLGISGSFRRRVFAHSTKNSILKLSSHAEAVVTTPVSSTRVRAPRPPPITVVGQIYVHV